ncbi:COG2426 family protein [Patescibacteria group bacterium]
MLDIDYGALFQSFPPEFATLLVAMTPIGELRAAIPVAQTAWNLSPFAAAIWSIIGNIIPVVVILLFLNPITEFLRRNSKLLNRFFTWLFARTRKRFTESKKKYGIFFTLVIFVAIPLPITGAWTGSIAAYLFGIPFRVAFSAILLGILIAAGIVTAITMGVISFF